MKQSISIILPLTILILAGCGYNPFKGIKTDDIVDISLKIEDIVAKEERWYQFDRRHLEMILYELTHSRKISLDDCIKSSDPIEFHLFLKIKTKEYKIEITNDRDFFWIKREDESIPFRYERLRDVLDEYKECGYNPFRVINVDDIVDISLKITNIVTKEEKWYQFDDKIYFDMILRELKYSRRVNFNDCLKEVLLEEFYLVLKTKTKEYKIKITNNRDFFWMKSKNEPITFRYEKLREISREMGELGTGELGTAPNGTDLRKN